MTTQQSLSQVWAETGGVTDPGTVKYEAGWIAEIPTYQNFNYVLQTTTKNILSLAEKGTLEWDTLVDYDAGSKVKEAGIQYFALAASTGQQPSLDVTHTYWSLLPTLGDAPTIADQSKGMHLANTQFDSNDLLWDGNAITITDYKPVIALSGTAKNWLIANSSSQLVAVDTDAVVVPDSRSIAPGQAGVHRLFHEGHPPVQSEVDDTIPTEPQDGKLYARRDGSWVESTTTAISISPPPPVAGVGHGWYNLDDGQFYLDIDDGDSSQWVPANAPYALDSIALYTSYDDSMHSTGETDAQGVIDYTLTKMDSDAYAEEVNDKQIIAHGSFQPYTGVVLDENSSSNVVSTVRDAVGTYTMTLDADYWLDDDDVHNTYRVICTLSDLFFGTIAMTQVLTTKTINLVVFKAVDGVQYDPAVVRWHVEKMPAI